MSQIWSKADIHVHTTYSDGHNTVAEVLTYAAQCTDLQVIAITDHDTITGALEARRMAADLGIEVIVGEEVSTADGHVLALFIEHWLPPDRPASETIAAIHAQGGLAIAAHPYDWMVPSLGLGRGGFRGRYQRAAGSWPLDGVEVFNASLVQPSMNLLAARDTHQLGLPACGGSDSHHVRTVGLGYTLFPGHSAADLRAAIIAGQTRADGSYWGTQRLAETVGLIIRRELRKVARLVTRPLTS